MHRYARYHERTIRRMESYISQLAAFALPELLPNKWRAAAIVLADLGVYFAAVVGPVAGRFAAENGESVSQSI